MMQGTYDIWGYDPMLSYRYAEFIGFCEGFEPDDTAAYIELRQPNPLFSILRMKYIIALVENHTILRTAPWETLPRLVLIRNFKVFDNSLSNFNFMMSSLFEPNRIVTLDRVPQPLPDSSGSGGTTKIVDESTDRITIEADINSPAILLVTDAYHPNWQVESLAGSCQKNYEIIPGDYVLRAIPLQAGRHLLRMEYRPSAFVIARWISIVSLIAFLCLCIWAWLYKSRQRKYNKKELTAVREI